MSYRFPVGGSLPSSLVNSLFNAYLDFMDSATGWTQYQSKQKQNQLQIDYNQYMVAQNEKALADFHKNEPGHSIKYPGLSYPGSILGYTKGIGSSYISNDIARANFYGSFPFKTAGLYGIAGRLSRYL